MGCLRKRGSPLFKPKTMKHFLRLPIITLAAVILFAGCSRDGNEPEPTGPGTGTEPEPELTVLVEGFNFISATSSNPAIITNPVEITRNDKVEAGFKIMYNNATGKDTTVTRNLAAYVKLTVNAPGEIVVSGSSTIGDPKIVLTSRKSENKADGIIANIRNYEISGFNGGFKPAAIAYADSATVTAHGKTAGIKFNNGFTPTGITYNDGEFIETIYIDGENYVKMKYNFQVNGKLGNQDVSMAFSQVFILHDPVTGEPAIAPESGYTRNGDVWTSKLVFNVERMFSGVKQFIFESELSNIYSAGDNVQVFKSNNIDIPYPENPLVENNELVLPADGIYSVVQKIKGYEFDFGDFKSYSYIGVEARTFEFEGRTYTLPYPETPEMECIGMSTPSETLEHTLPGYTTYYTRISVKAKFDADLESVHTSEVYIQVKDDTGYDINVERTKSQGGVTWAWKDGVKVPVVAVMYGKRENGDGGIKLYDESGVVIAKLPWHGLYSFTDASKITAYFYNDRWCMCEVINWGEYVWSSIERNISLDFISVPLENLPEGPAIPTTITENADTSITLFFSVNGEAKTITAKEF